MYGCESWTIKKAELSKNWCFWTVVLEKTLESPLEIQGRSNQSILKEISPECSLKELMLKLKLQYFGHQMRRADSLEKTLMLGKIESGRRRGRQRMRLVGWHHQLDGHEFEQALGVGDGQGSLACCSPWGCRDRHHWETELNWTDSSSLYWFILGWNFPCHSKRSLHLHSSKPRGKKRVILFQQNRLLLDQRNVHSWGQRNALIVITQACIMGTRRLRTVSLR